MKVSELIKALNLEVITESDYSDKEVNGCYIGDLLSRVMGKAQEKNAWITIMNNINILAVATLTEVSCIILCENVGIDENVLSKANEEGIVILKSPKSAYEIANEMGEILK